MTFAVLVVLQHFTMLPKYNNAFEFVKVMYKILCPF